MTVDEMTADYNEARQINWMIFAGVLVGMSLVAAVLVVMLNTIRASHREDEISRRAKYAACQAVENEPSRIVCINGWR